MTAGILPDLTTMTELSKLDDLGSTDYEIGSVDERKAFISERIANGEVALVRQDGSWCLFSGTKAEGTVIAKTMDGRTFEVPVYFSTKAGDQWMSFSWELKRYEFADAESGPCAGEPCRCGGGEIWGGSCEYSGGYAADLGSDFENYL